MKMPSAMTASDAEDGRGRDQVEDGSGRSSTPRKTTPTSSVSTTATSETTTRASERPSRNGKSEVGRDDDVLHHPVALAVLEDRLDQAGHHAEHDVPERAADDQELEELGALAAGDDLEHHHQDQGRGERLGERVDGEQERVGPVRLDRPAEADGGAEAPPRVGAASMPRTGARGRSLPSQRQASLAPGEVLEVAQREPGARRGRRRPSRPGSRSRCRPAGRPRRRCRRRRAAASRRGRRPAAASPSPAPTTAPSGAQREVDPAEEVDRLLEQLARGGYASRPQSRKSDAKSMPSP